MRESKQISNLREELESLRKDVFKLNQEVFVISANLTFSEAWCSVVTGAKITESRVKLNSKDITTIEKKLSLLMQHLKLELLERKNFPEYEIINKTPKVERAKPKI
uniref:Uncharacterized protein n=1 Tax=viral metagenome TaxID=1070528 RepID=A0A6M3JZ85_9ZZZZ